MPTSLLFGNAITGINYGSHIRHGSAPSIDPLTALLAVNGETNQTYIDALTAHFAEQESLGNFDEMDVWQSFKYCSTFAIGTWGLIRTATGLEPIQFSYSGTPGTFTAGHSLTGTADFFVNLSYNPGDGNTFWKYKLDSMGILSHVELIDRRDVTYTANAKTADALPTFFGYGAWGNCYYGFANTVYSTGNRAIYSRLFGDVNEIAGFKRKGITEIDIELNGVVVSDGSSVNNATGIANRGFYWFAGNSSTGAWGHCLNQKLATIVIGSKNIKAWTP